MDKVKMKRKKISVGDVFQILTSRGVSYGLVINTHPKWKYLVAVFEDVFDRQPDDFRQLINKQPQFLTFFLIQSAVNQGLFSIVAREKVPESLAFFPIFRSSNNRNSENPVWFFWDGEKQWRVERPLTEAEMKYPKGPSFPSAPLLVEWIEKGYRPERDYI